MNTIDLPPHLKNTLDAALLRLPKEDRPELLDYVLARLSQLDRPLTPQRLASIIGGGLHRLKVLPR